MFNVHIHEFKVGDAVLDAAALVQFQRQWATYGKVVAGNWLSHREVGGLLHETLNETFARPFDFLDIACGDASMMPTALAGTRIRHYHGIDLSKPALDLPETPAVWCELGRDAGFGEARGMFVDPTDLYRMFRYVA